MKDEPETTWSTKVSENVVELETCTRLFALLPVHSKSIVNPSDTNLSTGDVTVGAAALSAPPETEIDTDRAGHHGP